ncbi:TIGR02117 family protein [Stakelama sp. CBK3Z-3]|uniref:TIGR02117 family protein n=1 Tax=Stakelama flava TaxID=2860338 RepID=A0ABS6XLV2_9SPHN|nr:TIGR02117 family protein [Stakelama flava]MBW4331188.1 TIGR02117 family protein [Stakelama flava]
MPGNHASLANALQRFARTFAAVLLGLSLLSAAYIAAGLIGGVLPANRQRIAPERGIRIYVEDNGIHTGIVVPKQAAGVDWSTLVRAGDIADPRYAAYGYLSFGWGDRAFYIGTPTWSDLNLRTVARAAIGSDDTVLHVEHIPPPTAGPRVRSIVLSPAEYRRLAGFIRSSFAPGAVRSVHGYGRYDAFYDARGHYSAIRTCNAWTGAALRFAGVEEGIWTPFPDSVMLLL